ncbi:mpv17-like protein [Culicoides brevitarsis]|uniref:mpv17-like protein n=1 Tax=Culicoides brevitarsis TaxID=469753 RepID=UPI00307B819C
MLSKVGFMLKKHPILKGMISYSIIWPTGSLIQQTIAGENYDFKKALRFCIFGSCIVAPSLYGWIRLTSEMFPLMNLKTGLTKAVIEQFTYGPAASVTFFYGMSLMEFKTHKEAVMEVKQKFPETWKVGVCVWPVVQTINFSFIAEKNRVPFVSMASLLWTTFLAYMKQLDKNKENEESSKTEEF